MGSNTKLANGALANVPVNLAGLKPLPTTSGLAKFMAILKSAFPFLGFLTIYGLNPHIPIFPRYKDLACIHLYNISAVEYSVLGFHPHEMVSAHSAPILDVLAAIPYLMHYFVPIAYPLFLLATGRTESIARFYWLLGWAMWIHFIFWYLFPTAPPWLYDNLELYTKRNYTTMPPLHLQHKEGCAFGRLDSRSGLGFFFNMFGGNPVPFASFPSGHVAWPTCILLTLPPVGKVFALYVLWVAWATLYSCHHYLSDALTAVLLCWFTRKLLIWLANRPSRTREAPCNLNILCPINMV